MLLQDAAPSVASEARLIGRIPVRNIWLLFLYASNLARFHEFTFDTPRNRLVRAALDALARRVDDELLSHECARLAGDLGRQGVGGLKPSRAALSADRLGRNDADDLLMVTLARLVFDLV